MISSAIFTRYAGALADVVRDKAEEAAVRRDLETYREIFRQVPALLDALESPAIERDAKERVVAGLFERYPATPTVRNFLRLLLDHHRMRHFAEICDAFARTMNVRNGIVAAKVTSAAPMGEVDLAALRESLVRATGGRVTLSVETDPSLLAGVVVQIGSTVYDGSIRTQLDEMRRHLGQE